MKTILEEQVLFNQSEIARRLNISPAYVCRILKNERTGPKAQKIKKEIEKLLKNVLKAA